MESFQFWDKSHGFDSGGDMISGKYCCEEFQKYLRLNGGKCTWKKHWYAFQDHVKYINNNIVKPFRVKILQQDKFVCEMHDLSKYLTLSSNKGDIFDKAYWRFRYRDLAEDEISFTKKYGIPQSIHYNME